MASNLAHIQVKAPGRRRRNLKKFLPTYLLILPAMLFVLVFNYFPIPGLLMAFMDYDIFKGFGSDWVGLANIIEIFSIPQFGQAILNTIYISLLNLVIVFPAPILFALLLNEIKRKTYKRVVQTVSYMPYFLSWIAVIGIASSVYSTYGIVNDIRVALFGEDTQRIMFLGEQSFFVPNVVSLNLWKNTSWNAIVYLAAISSIDPCLYESANMDGAGKFRQCWHITLPGILPTVVMLFILQVGQLFSDNFELIYGLQNAFIDFDVISTVIYKRGITQGQYSMATAFGFVQGLIGFILITLANYFSRKVNGYSIW